MKCFLSPAYREDMAATTSWHTLHFQLSRGIEVCKQWSARLFDCLWFKLHMFFCGVIDGDIISLFGKSASHAVCEPFLRIDKKEMLFFLTIVVRSHFVSLCISFCQYFCLPLFFCLFKSLFCFPYFFPPFISFSLFIFILLSLSVSVSLYMNLSINWNSKVLYWHEFLKTCLKAS